MQEDLRAMKIVIGERSHVLKSVESMTRYVNDMLVAWEEIHQMMALDGNKSLTVEFLSFCANSSSSETLSQSNTGLHTPDSDMDYSSFSWLMTDDHSQCPQEFTNWKQRFRNIPNYSKAEFTDKLSALIQILGNDTFDFMSNTKMKPCTPLIEEVQNCLLSFQKDLNLSIQMLSADIVSEALRFALDIFHQKDVFFMEPKCFTIKTTGLVEDCQVLIEWGKYMNATVDKVATKLEEVEELIHKANDVLYSFGSSLKGVTAKYLAPLANLTRSYTWQHITKLEWANRFSSPFNLQSLISMQSENEKVKNGIQAIYSFTTRGIDLLQEAYVLLMPAENPEASNNKTPSALILSTFLQLPLVNASRSYNPVHRREYSSSLLPLFELLAIDLHYKP